MCLGYTPLMVTKNGDHSICLIVGIELLLKSGVRKRLVVELVLEGDRRIISTEDLRSETLHVGSKVLVESSSLSRE